MGNNEFCYGVVDHREYDLMKESEGLSIKGAPVEPGRACWNCMAPAKYRLWVDDHGTETEHLDSCLDCSLTTESELRQMWVCDAIGALYENEEPRMRPKPPIMAELAGRAKTAEPNPKDLIGITKVPNLSVIPSTGLVHMGRAMEDGASKYGPFNWREHPVRSGIYVDAAVRHLMAWQDGEEDADDSGVHHLGHAMACFAILLDAQEAGNLLDERVPGPAAELLARFKR